MAPKLRVPSFNRRTSFSIQKCPELLSLPLATPGDRITAITASDPFFLYLGTENNRLIKFNVETMLKETAINTFHSNGIVSIRGNADYLMCADKAGGVIIYDLSNMNNSAMISVGGPSDGELTLEINSDLVLAHKKKSDGIDVLEAKLPLEKVLRQDAIYTKPRCCTFYKNGDVIAGVKHDVRLYQVDEEGSFLKISQITSFPDTISCISLAADTHDLLWVATQNGRLYAVDLESGNVTDNIVVSSKHTITKISPWSKDSLVVSLDSRHCFVIFTRELRRVAVSKEIISEEAFQVYGDMLFFSTWPSEGAAQINAGKLQFVSFSEVSKMMESKHSKKLAHK